MFIPFKDNNPITYISFAYVNWTLIAINILVFVFLQGGITGSPETAVSYGIIPAVFFSTAKLDPALITIPVELTVLTYMFFHGGWVHLISNMLFLWVFGDNIEDSIGHFGYLAFYLLCGVAAGLTHAIALPGSDAPLVGASGAVAGVMGAYFLLHPRVRVWILILWRIPVPLPAVLVIGVWIGLQILSVFMATKGNIAWWAHISGFVVGLFLIIFMRRKSVPLFDTT